MIVTLTQWITIYVKTSNYCSTFVKKSFNHCRNIGNSIKYEMENNSIYLSPLCCIFLIFNESCIAISRYSVLAGRVIAL
jgi:hypothetical protein